LQKLLQTFGISILLQPITSAKCKELHIYNEHRAVALCRLWHMWFMMSLLCHRCAMSRLAY